MLNGIVDWILYSVFRLDPASSLAGALNFFIYDSVKILLLLFVMISIIGFLRTYLPQDRVKKWLTGKKSLPGHVIASMFGAITPFCSCSSIPIFLSFLEAGIPLGVTFSFLITSPLVNEYLAVLMLGFFGWKITLAYVAGGMLIGTLAGFVLGKMSLGKYLAEDMVSARGEAHHEVKYDRVMERVKYGLNEAISITRKLWVWVLVGVGIGAVIHDFIPSEAIQSIVRKGGLLSVPVAVFLGVPMYGSCAAIVPIAIVLFQKGLPLGTALAFMMGVAALSFPEAVILRRAMRLKLIAIFFGVVTSGIILTGYAFNILQNILV